MKDSKTVLLIVDRLDKGGLAHVLLTLACGLLARGHRVGLALLENRVAYPLPETAWLRINEAERPSRRWRHTAFRREVTGFARQAISDFETEYGKADLIIAAGELAIRCVPPIHHPRIVFSSHSSQLQAAKMSGLLGQLRLGFKHLRRGLRLQRLLNGRHVHVVSDGLAKELTGSLKVRPASVHVIYNPFDIDAIREAARQSTPESLKRLRPFVIGVGLLTKNKHFSRLVEAFADSGVDGDLVLVGQGGDEEALRQLAKAKGLDGRFEIIPFHHNHYALLAKASLLVVTSDSEGLSNVLCESLIVGVPALSTDCPHGPRDILGGIDERALVPLDRIDLLPERIHSLLDKPYDITDAMVERFSVDKVIDQYLALIDMLDE
ncbi:glycosyltransferase [Crenobacter sp. SG2305]|uniref:glycosyltransferase n=1 Tax=Crenobacter oryzisoli TaxID=3056844 RepID=UPI0025AA699B|nr:glycosyltransferase [Crenobacter sp. SG2305]MDN0084109.1 glycosyltransferase [Crenobacter sp. SG2305]